MRRKPTGTPTVVSVTPMGIERESRTFKQAATLARAGYRSIVVEGERSVVEAAALPFELVTVEDAAPVPGHATETEPAPESDVETVARQLGGGWIARRRAAYILRRERAKQPWLRLRAFQDLNQRALTTLPDADLFITHAYVLAPAVLRKSGSGRHRPLLYDAHDLYFDLDREEGERLAAGDRIWRRVERRTIRVCVGYMTPTEGLADALEAAHGRRPEVVRNCHDARLDRPVNVGARRAAGLGDDDFLLVAVGNDKEGMTAAEVIRSLTQLPERVHLLFLGRGYEPYRDLTDELGLSGRVHLQAPVAPDQVVPFIASADAALVPYRARTRGYAEALPNRFFQAFAAGLPVLYSRELTEVAVIAERHRLGLAFDTNDPASIAAAARRVAEDGELRAALGRGAEAGAEAESWEREEPRFLGLVEAALPQGSLEGVSKG